MPLRTVAASRLQMAIGEAGGRRTARTRRYPFFHLTSTRQPKQLWRRRPLALLSGVIALYLLLGKKPSRKQVLEGYESISGIKYGSTYGDQWGGRRNNHRDTAQHARIPATKAPKQKPASAVKEHTVPQSRASAAPTRKPVQRKKEGEGGKKAMAKDTSRPNNTNKHELRSPLFHMVFTTGSTTLGTLNVRSIESVFYSNPGARLHIHQPSRIDKREGFNRVTEGSGSDVKNSPNYTQWRELDQTHPRLAPLMKYGCNITFHRYDPVVVLEQAVNASKGKAVEVNATAARSFIGSLSQYRKEPFWYSNESNLLRLALLYLQGGTYMDTDVILLQPYDGVVPGGGGSPNKAEPIPRDGAVAAPENNVIPFPKPGHPFIAAALNNFMAHYNGTVWGNNGPRVIKRILWDRQDLVCKGRTWNEVLTKWTKEQHRFGGINRRRLKAARGRGDVRRELPSENRSYNSKRCVTVLDKKVIQPIGWRKWYDHCISKNSPTGSRAKLLLEAAYAAHLNNKLTGGIFERGDTVYTKGSVCDLLMTRFCNVCP